MQRVYIGTYTTGESQGIYRADLNPDTGALTLRGVAAETENPSFLAQHPTLPVLYAVGEMTADGGAVSAFSMDPESGALTLLNRVSSEGGAPCHVAVAPGGKHVAVANYMGGSVALFPVEADGSLKPACAVMQHAGAGPNPQRQEAPHAHSVDFDETGKRLLVADLGTDKVYVYTYDAGAGTLTPNDPPFAALPPGSGPRHVALHPGGGFVYVVNELASTVTAFAYAPDSGRMSPLSSLTTLPADFEGDSTTAEIRVNAAGTMLYASNRGHDSVAVYSLTPEPGRPTPAGHVSTGGKTPRNFTLDPANRYLLAANQQSDSVVVFRLGEDGLPVPAGSEITVSAPVCVLFARP